MFPHTVTLYNQDGNTWRKTVLKGVFWDSSTGATLRKTGVAPADGVRLLIPRPMPGFTKPRVWESLADKTGAWTLRGGDKVVYGKQSEVASTKDFAQMEDVITITIVDDHNFGGLAHFEVTGK